ncbi:MAG TPA: protease pro-enzyme activation domain-containing protein, partial [Verrucomicrobiae bacterium]|nr:protease pro-enzyme activation domain-containing protein [Verrucomicrobiae bacterium]
LVIALPLRNQNSLSNLLQELYDPASAQYHRFLSADEFARRFSPTTDDYEKLARFARASGFEIVGRHPNRTLLDVRAPAGKIERALHVRMQEYQHPTERRRFFSADAAPSLDLQIPVLSISGLNDFTLPRPLGTVRMADAAVAAPMPNTTGSGPLGTLLGGDFRAAYAPGVALTGAGQAIGIFSLDGYYRGDVSAYEDLAGLPHVAVTNVLVNGFGGLPGANNIEVSLDISMAVSMAPGLEKVIVYEGNNPNDILNVMATRNEARQLSCSWGFQPAIDAARDQIFQQFAAQGQSFFQASGDLGAWGQGIFPPSDNPYITIVGGTTLETETPGGAWESETTWPGSGGGFSTNYAIPAWQQGLNFSQSKASATQRNIPDVACAADSFFWLVANNGEFYIASGTSASAPLWAGFAALANQQAASTGQPPLGFLNPSLYSIGKSAGYTAAFHDIFSGNNTNSTSPDKYFAVPGYDLCTGWGTPAGSNLISGLISPPSTLVAGPATEILLQGQAGGPFLPSSGSFSLTNFGQVAFNWSAIQTAPWLKLSSVSGTLAPGGPSVLIIATLTDAATNLPPGTYTSTIAFNNSADYSTQTRQVVLAVTTPPVITLQPTSQQVFEGATASLSAQTAPNAFINYQWQFDNGTGRVNLVDGANISGATGPALTIRAVSTTNVGMYSLAAQNSA